jgi:hypothetical protein
MLPCGMANPFKTDNAPGSRAQTAFTASEQRDAMVRQMIDKERAATDAKTAKLRALRLAKEAEDAAAAAANPPPPKTRKRKV